MIGLQVFSATLSRQRDELGDVITTWIRSHPKYRLVDRIVVQSSDSRFHCLTIVIVYESS